MRPVELMSCGRTDPQLIDLLMKRFPRYGLVPFHVRKESVGLIFNRIWQFGMKLADGRCRAFFRLRDGAVGLDVVLDIEEHYASIRPGIPDGPRELLRSYLAKGWAGRKTGRGFYDDYSAKDYSAKK